MTTYLYPDPSYGTTVVRTNLHPDPRYIGADGVTGAASAWTQEDWPSGGPDGRGFTRFVVTEDQTSSANIGQDAWADVVAGERYAFTAHFFTSRTGVTVDIRVRFDTSAGAQVSVIDSEDVTVPAGRWTRLAIADVVPDGAARARVIVSIRNTALRLDDIVGVANRMVEEGSSPTSYFDGGHEAVFPYSYAWAGAENASESYELVPAGLVTPKVVLNYATEAATGVTVLTPAFGRAPLIVRTEPKYLSGTFEFLAPDRATARQIFNLCDGSTNVRIVSDDGLVAATGTDQLRFTPTGTVRLSQNVPYDSWTVTVPYQEADYEEPA